MGYISIQINKAKGSADMGASDHIERKSRPKNADPTRTHLNRELVEFPDGVANRTEAISHRIRTAGSRRNTAANWWNCKPSTAGKWRTRKRHTKRKCHS